MSRILLVEDSRLQARVVTSSLEQTEYEVECVEQLRDAVQQVISGDYVAVILDLSLPDSEGWNTYQRMREATAKIPIIVLTSTDDEELALQMLRSGAQDYLIKGEVTADWIARSLRYSIERFAAAHSERDALQVLAPDRKLNLVVEQLDDVTMLRIQERQLFGGDVIEQLSSQLFKLVDEEGKRKFVLNCAGVDYISNSVLAQLLVWDKKVRRNQGSMRICNLKGSVQEQIKARKLLAQFDICLDEATALQGF